MTIYIDFVGTEAFFNNVPGPGNKLQSVKDWCNTVWSEDIRDGSGDYYASFAWRDAATVEVPESTLCESCILCDRRADADGWLFNNYGYYDSADAIVTLDYAPGLDPGCAGSGSTAGDAWDITCTANASLEHNDNLNKQYDSVGTEGVAAHELAHLFDADHVDSAATESGNVSLLYGNNGDTPCYIGPADTVVQWYNSTCEVPAIRSYVDSNL